MLITAITTRNIVVEETPAKAFCDIMTMSLCCVVSDSVEQGGSSDLVVAVAVVVSDVITSCVKIMAKFSFAIIV